MIVYGSLTPPTFAPNAQRMIASLGPMPGTNGFELFQEIRKEREFATLPFVFLTGVDDYYAKKFGKDLGSAAYITKPVDLDELVQIIKEKIGE